MRKLSFVLIFLFLSSTVFSQSWELAKEKEGIQVFTMIRDGAAMKSYRVQMSLEVEAESVLAAILNVDAYAEWMPDCLESRELEKTEEGLIAYYVAGAPWPISSRDNISHMKIVRSENEIRVDFSQLPDYLAANKDYVRLEECAGYWKIEKLGDAGLRLSQEVHVNPGGKIPAWLVNMTVEDSPIETFENLRTRLNN